jgi:predicted N-formylglutamate amidohydrolase
MDNETKARLAASLVIAKYSRYLVAENMGNQDIDALQQTLFEIIYNTCFLDMGK